MKLIDFKSPFLTGDMKPYRYMFTNHRWNVLNIEWAPRRRPPRYHDHLNAVFTILMHYLLFH